MKKITLKSLQQELENLKSHSSSKITKNNKSKPAILTKGGIGHDIKNSFIQRLYMKSGAFSLYLITGILGYAHKLPFIGKIIGILAAWYGKTTIWKMLVKIRKIFIVMNAIIGVFVVFKSVGFSTDNLLIGFTAMGETYLQTLFGLVKRLFHWFVELFDHKVVPNVPGDNGGTWFSKPLPPKNNSIFVPSNINIPNLLENDTFSLRKLYKDAVPGSTPWYRDTSSWFWILTIAGTIGFAYVGYKIYADPSIIISLFKSNPTINTQAPTPPNDPSGSNITLEQAATGSIGSGITNITKGLVNIYKYTSNKLNPFNYFIGATDAEQQLDLFIEKQNDYNRADRSLYPFTPRNPFDSWFKRTRIYYFGEGAPELMERMQRREYADRVYEMISTKGKGIDLSNTGTVEATSILSAPSSPAPRTPYLSGETTPTGLLTPTGLNIYKNLHGSDIMVQTKITALSSAPTDIPSADWSESPIEKGDDHYENMEKWKRWKDSGTSKSFEEFEKWTEVTKGIKNPVSPDLDEIVPNYKGLYRAKLKYIPTFAQVAAQETADGILDKIVAID